MQVARHGFIRRLSTANKRGDKQTSRVLSPNCILLSKWLSTVLVVSGTMLYIPWKRKLSSFLALVRAPLLRTAISPPRLSSFLLQHLSTRSRVLPPGDTRDNDGIGTLFESEGETEREANGFHRFVSFRFVFVLAELFRRVGERSNHQTLLV